MKNTFSQNKLSRIENKTNLLSIYFTAGFPQLESTVSICLALEQAGVDLIEIGIPFSDPLADGPTIQASSQQALKHGMSLKILFEQLQNLPKNYNVPIVLMGYLNVVMQFGIEKFLSSCQENNISGVIIPDLPLEVFVENYRELFTKYNVAAIFLCTPSTDVQRIKLIDSISQGFIYLVSANSTTGSSALDLSKTKDFLMRISKLKLKNPCLVGFGIRSFEQINELNQINAPAIKGYIVGSAFINHLASSYDLANDIPNFIRQLRGE